MIDKILSNKIRLYGDSGKHRGVMRAFLRDMEDCFIMQGYFGHVASVFLRGTVALARDAHTPGLKFIQPFKARGFRAGTMDYILFFIRFGLKGFSFKFSTYSEMELNRESERNYRRFRALSPILHTLRVTQHSYGVGRNFDDILKHGI